MRIRASIVSAGLAMLLTAAPVLAATYIEEPAPNGGNTYRAVLDPDTFAVADNVDFSTRAAKAVQMISVQGVVWDTALNRSPCGPKTLYGVNHAGCTAYAANGHLRSAEGTHTIVDAIYGNWNKRTELK